MLTPIELTAVTGIANTIAKKTMTTVSIIKQVITQTQIKKNA